MSSWISKLAIPAAERTAAILDALSGSVDSTYFVPSENGYLELPVVEVSVELLVYRADNGRVLSELTEEALRLGTSFESLKDRADNVEVQSVLHHLLLEKARDPDGPIYDELRRFGRQTEPLLIGRDGVVLNGNRRLASMRELSSLDTGQYGNFQRLRVAVLPDDLSRYEVEFIEAALQMAPDLKLEYGWVNRRLKLRQHAQDIDRDKIVEAYRFADGTEIDRQLGELELAEAYLEWIEQPRHLALLDDREAVFAKFYQMLAELEEPHARDTWRLLGFAMIKAEAALEGNILHYYPFTSPVPPPIRRWVPRTLAEDNGVVERQDFGENRPFNKNTAVRLRPLIENHNDAEKTAVAVVALIDTLKGSHRKLLGYNQLMVQLRRAHEIVEEMELETLSPAQLRQVRAQVASLQKLVETAEPGQAGGARAGTTHGAEDIQAGLRKVWRTARRPFRR